MTRFRKSFLVLLIGAGMHLTAAAAPDVVPLTFINNLPFVNVKVGAASTQLMIDSGGKLGISLPGSTVTASGSVTLLDEKTRFRDLHGQVFEVQNLVANQVVVGATAVKPVQGRIHTEWGGAPEGQDAALTQARRAGAIGLAAFGDRALEFDYARRRLSIHAAGQGPQQGQDGWHELPLEYGAVGPNIVLHIHGKALKFVLDTGAQINLVDPASVPQELAERSCVTTATPAPACDPRSLGEAHDGQGRSVGALSAERVKLGGAPFDGILGAPFFSAHRVLIDLTGKRLLIAPNRE